MLDFQMRYDAGDRDRTFVKQYIDVLFKAYRPQLQKEVVSEYINGLSDTEFYTRETWDIIIRNLSDPLSPILKKVAANRYRFSHIVSRDTIDIFMDYILKSAVSNFVWWTPDKGVFNQQRYDQLLAYLYSAPAQSTSVCGIPLCSGLFENRRHSWYVGRNVSLPPIRYFLYPAG